MGFGLVRGMFLCLACISLVWGQWPNEPAGSQQLLDFSFQTIEGSGLILHGGSAALKSDGTAPFSPSNFVRYTYWVGMAGGIAPAKHYCSAINGRRELYVGYWWRPSNPFEGHSSNCNKISFLLGNSVNDGHVILQMYGTGSGGQAPYVLMIYLPQVADVCNSQISNSYGDVCGTRQVFGNISAGNITLGQWHRVEMYTKVSTTRSSQDGILRWWLDGVLVGDHRNVNFGGPWAEFQFDPTWGGTGGVKTQEDYFDFDHVRLSAPNGTVLPPTPLAITGLSQTAAQVGKPFSGTLQAQNGKAPYSWTITAGSLPAGLSLNKTTGIISGTPTSCGRSDFTVKVMDSNVPLKEATRNFTIIVSGTCTSGIEENKKLTVNGSRLTVESRTGTVLFRVQQNGGYSLRVFDLSGKMVHAHKGQGGIEIEIEAALKNGIYFARLTQGGKESTVRFNILN